MVLPVVVPASLSNLGPGFDCLGLALSTFNQFMVSHEGPAGTYQEGYETIPEPDDHLVFATVRAAEQAFGTPLDRGLRLIQQEGVPRSRGLGSSATARVAGLIAWMHHSHTRPPLDEALDFLTTLEGHPDNVVAAMLGGVTLATASQGTIKTRRLEPLPGLRIALAIPDVEVSTEDARAVLPEAIPLAEAAANGQRLAFLLHGLLTGDTDSLRLGMDDVLHQPYRAPLIGPVDEALRRATDAGAATAFISGSGSTLAALVVDPEADTARVARALARPFRAARVRVTEQVARPALLGAWRMYLDNAVAYGG